MILSAFENRLRAGLV